MTGFTSLEKLFAVLFNTGLVSKIYHSVTIHENQETKERYPVYKSGDEEIYVGVDDTKLMSCYLRQTGDAQNIRTEFVGSGAKRYWTRVPYRIVFFNDWENRNFDTLHSTMMQMMFNESIEFVKHMKDKKVLQAQEGNIKDFHFGGKTFYTAIDFNLTLKLTYNYCGIALGCGELPNPLCLEDIGTLLDGDGGELIDIDDSPILTTYHKPKKIYQLPECGVINDTDLMIKGDPVTGLLCKIKISDLVIGGGSGIDTKVVAGVNMSSGRIVYINLGKAYYFDPLDENLAGFTLGITKNAALSDDDVEVQLAGVFEQGGLGLTPDKKYYVGTNGTLVTTIAGLKIVQQIGVSISTNKLSLNIYSPIITN